MDEKGFVTIKINDFTTVVHYLKDGDVYHCLTLSDTTKVSLIKDVNEIMVSNGINSNDFKVATVNLVEDSTQIKKVFEDMTSINHNHFKEWDDKLVGIDFIL